MIVLCRVAEVVKLKCTNRSDESHDIITHTRKKHARSHRIGNRAARLLSSSLNASFIVGHETRISPVGIRVEYKKTICTRPSNHQHLFLVSITPQRNV